MTGYQCVAVWWELVCCASLDTATSSLWRKIHCCLIGKRNRQLQSSSFRSESLLGTLSVVCDEHLTNQSRGILAVELQAVMCITAPDYNYHWQPDLFFEVHAAEDGNTKVPQKVGEDKKDTLRTADTFFFKRFWLVTGHAFYSFFHVTNIFPALKIFWSIFSCVRYMDIFN